MVPIESIILAASFSGNENHFQHVGKKIAALLTLAADQMIRMIL
jgi:hypothetical protein